MFYYDFRSLAIMIPLVIFSTIIQSRLHSTYNKYSKTSNSKFTSGADIARLILNSSGVYNVSVEMVGGNLTDHFDPSKNVIRLSEAVYNGTSISAIGVAAHETGHALQYAANYAPMRIRSAVVGVTNFSSKLLYILMILSVIIYLPVLCDIAVLCFAVLFFFQLITLPVEFNASARAIEQIRSFGYNDGDIKGVKKVLSAAAMTYVAAMLYSLAQLVSFFLRTRRNR